MLRLNDLHIRYGGLNVASGLSFRLKAGMIHTLIGPSGCGKSTLLKVLCGIHSDFSGDIVRDEAALGGREPRIGYVPQQYGLLEWKTVRENIELPWRLGPSAVRRALPPEETRKREAAEVVHALGLEDVLDHYPHEVSGGQRQRAALARAFVLAPDLLLMDEPFSALDAFTAEVCMNLFLSLWRKRSVTTLLITHSMHEAAKLGERLLIMGRGPRGGSLLGVMENPAFGSDDEKERAPVVAELALRLREAMPR